MIQLKPVLGLYGCNSCSRDARWEIQVYLKFNRAHAHVTRLCELCLVDLRNQAIEETA